MSMLFLAGKTAHVRLLHTSCSERIVFREHRVQLVGICKLLMASNKPKRARKTPNLLKDSEVFDLPVVHSQSKPGIYIRASVSITCIYYILFNLVWCTVEIAEGKEYVVTSDNLETELGDPVGETDLFFGNMLIWKERGKPYQVKLTAVSSKQTMLLTYNVNK